VSGTYTERYNAARAAVFDMMHMLSVEHTDEAWEAVAKRVAEHFIGHPPITVEVEMEVGGIVRYTVEYIAPENK
jgi:translation initiation factor 2 alpha subunit (eIF-2alpha)